MKFDVEGIKNLTFPSGAMGYKKKDVDDFLIYVAKDYGSYQRQLEKSKQETEEAEQEKQELLKKLEEQKAADAATLEKFKQENQALKQQITSLQTESVSNNLNEDTALSLAQKVALRIEKQAKEEAQERLMHADRYYEEQVRKLEQKRKEISSEVVTSLSELIGSERMIVASIDNSSIEAAINGINYFASKKKFYKGKSILVLGETADLGNQTVEQHKRLEPAINAALADKVIIYGEPFKHLKLDGDNVVQCDTKEQIIQEICEEVTNDSFAFVKGSHGIGFYEVVNMLKEKANFVENQF